MRKIAEKCENSRKSAKNRGKMRKSAKNRGKSQKVRKIAEKACKKAATYGMIGKLWGDKLWEDVL